MWKQCYSRGKEQLLGKRCHIRTLFQGISHLQLETEKPQELVDNQSIISNMGNKGFKTMKRHREDEIDFDRMRRYRLNRIREELVKRDIGACLLFDPVNITYALDAASMSVFCLHNLARYCFIPASGPTILYEFQNNEHNVEHLELIDEIRPGVALEHTLSGQHAESKVKKMVQEIVSVVEKHCDGNKRLAIDQCGGSAYLAFHKSGIEIMDAKEVTEHARKIKNEDEITCLKASVEVAEEGIREIQNQLIAGITEAQLWSHLHKVNIANGGQWVQTGLLTSGVRTNPWLSECSNKIIESGEIVAFDTDMVGPYAYGADLSRTFVEGGKFSSDQKKLYEVALKHIDHNVPLIKPGVTMREFTEKSFPLEEKYLGNRYCCIVHGVGLVVEYPFVNYAIDGGLLDEHFQENMCISVETYIGEVGGKEGVKLENQYVVRENGLELLSHHPFENI